MQTAKPSSPSAQCWPPPTLDRARLQQALSLAESSFGTTDPNPRVGCVIGLEDGRLLGQGSTQQAGGPHAEVMALRDAQTAGRAVCGATVWVTLEPCAHHGRTPPCCDALIAAGVSRVVVAVGDPFPQVAGAGLARLRAAGIDVVMAADAGAPDIAAAARDINIGFFSRVQRGLPWLRLKVAASLDGRTALNNGVSQWITGAEARADGHAWRRRASAVLTGIGTVLEDDPRLDVRAVPTLLQPLRVVVDSRLQTPPSAKLLQAPSRGVLVFAAEDNADRRTALQARGAEVLLQPSHDAMHGHSHTNTNTNTDTDSNSSNSVGKVDLPAMLRTLAARGVNELHVEAGHKLNASLLRAGLVDELLVYLAPKLLGLGREMAAFGPLTRLDDALDFEFFDHRMVGNDLRLRARPPGRDSF